MSAIVLLFNWGFPLFFQKFGTIGQMYRRPLCLNSRPDSFRGGLKNRSTLVGGRAPGDCRAAGHGPEGAGCWG
jgi:hypothetical protein